MITAEEDEKNSGAVVGAVGGAELSQADLSNYESESETKMEAIADENKDVNKAAVGPKYRKKAGGPRKPWKKPKGKYYYVKPKDESVPGATISFRKTWRYRCCVVGCNTTRATHPQLSFYQVPMKEDRCRIWMTRAGRKAEFEKRGVNGCKYYFKICSLHFEDRFYIDKYLNPDEEVVGFGRRLKTNAVPTLFTTAVKQEPLPEVPPEPEQDCGIEVGLRRKLVCSKCCTVFARIDCHRKHVAKKACSSIAYNDGHETFDTLHKALQYVRDKEMDTFFYIRSARFSPGDGPEIGAKITRPRIKHEVKGQSEQRTYIAYKCSTNGRPQEMKNSKQGKGGKWPSKKLDGGCPAKFIITRKLIPSKTFVEEHKPGMKHNVASELTYCYEKDLEERYILTGCLRHSHPIEERFMRMSQLVKDELQRLFDMGLSVDAVRDKFLVAVGKDRFLLPMHVKAHEEGKPLKYITKSFLRGFWKDRVSDHVCEICNTTYAKYQNLKQHTEDVHGLSRNSHSVLVDRNVKGKYQCQFCDFSCGRSDNYKKHMDKNKHVNASVQPNNSLVWNSVPLDNQHIDNKHGGGGGGAATKPGNSKSKKGKGAGAAAEARRAVMMLTAQGDSLTAADDYEPYGDEADDDDDYVGSSSGAFFGGRAGASPSRRKAKPSSSSSPSKTTPARRLVAAGGGFTMKVEAASPAAPSVALLAAAATDVDEELQALKEQAYAAVEKVLTLINIAQKGTEPEIQKLVAACDDFVRDLNLNRIDNPVGHGNRKPVGLGKDFHRKCRARAPEFCRSPWGTCNHPGDAAAKAAAKERSSPPQKRARRDDSFSSSDTAVQSTAAKTQAQPLRVIQQAQPQQQRQQQQRPRLLQRTVQPLTVAATPEVASTTTSHWTTNYSTVTTTAAQPSTSAKSYQQQPSSSAQSYQQQPLSSAQSYQLQLGDSSSTMAVSTLDWSDLGAVTDVRTVQQPAAAATAARSYQLQLDDGTTAVAVSASDWTALGGQAPGAIVTDVQTVEYYAVPATEGTEETIIQYM